MAAISSQAKDETRVRLASADHVRADESNDMTDGFKIGTAHASLDASYEFYFGKRTTLMKDLSSYFDPDLHAGDVSSSENETDKLDAYGHMTWTLGDDDWTACFDAVRVGGEIHYHVVVNCESGHWIDTLETGAARVDNPQAIAELIALPGRYVDSAIENHLDARRQREPVGRLSYRKCEKAWARHIKQLVKQKPTPEPDEDYSEEQTLDYFNRYVAGDR